MKGVAVPQTFFLLPGKIAQGSRTASSALLQQGVGCRLLLTCTPTEEF